MILISKNDAIGSHVEEIETPALLVRLDALDRNIGRLAEFGRQHSIAVRPHSKGHKCATIAHRQIRSGAVGVCCQKLGEVEVMAASGVPDITLTNEIVEPSKLLRLCHLAHTTNIRVVVDNVLAGERLDAAARAASVVVEVLIDVNVGQNRCGVSPGVAALTLAQALGDLRHVRLVGLQGYQGRLQHVSGWDKRCDAARSASVQLHETKEMFIRHGLSTAVVSGAGTGTYQSEADARVINEIQAGSYIFMDKQYLAIGGRTSTVYNDFELALSVLTTVISTPEPDRCVVDAGLKAVSCDTGTPDILECPGREFTFAGDEHGVLTSKTDGGALRLGQKLQLIPGHCDTTANLYDYYHVIRDDRLVALWPINARGRIQ